jgi:hypothetical protein
MRLSRSTLDQLVTKVRAKTKRPIMLGRTASSYEIEDWSDPDNIEIPYSGSAGEIVEYLCGLGDVPQPRESTTAADAL